MSRNEKAVLCFGIFLTPLSLAAQQDGEPQMVRPQDTVIFKECLPETVCRSDLAGLAKDFTLRWSSRRVEKYLECMTMEMEGRTFEITMSPDFVRSISFPLDLVTFSDDLTLYGIIADTGISNVFVNYFTRDDDGAFHYLGKFPHLSFYDESRGLLVGSERYWSGNSSTHYFKLKDTSLVLEYFENSLVLWGEAEPYSESRYDTPGPDRAEEFFSRYCR